MSLTTAPQSAHDLWGAPPPVAVFEGVDRARFETEIQPRQRPAVLKGLVANWEFVRQGRRDPAGVLATIAGYAPRTLVNAFRGDASIKGRFFYTDDFSGFNFDRVQAPFAGFAQKLTELADAQDPEALYAGAVPIKDALAGAAAACPMPLLDPSTERLTSFWIGNRTRTAAHWDLPQNLACVVAGRRRFTLFPIEQVMNLYMGPMDRTLAGQPTSCVDFAAPDLEQFPGFQDAWAAAEEVVLEPGDALYLPSLWMHHVEGLDPIGIMVNFWWRDGPDHLITPFLTLLHALLTLRDMPAHERDRWRTLFDAFIFQTGGDPQAHLSDTAKGVFGPPTPQTLAAIRQHLARTLNR